MDLIVYRIDLDFIDPAFVPAIATDLSEAYNSTLRLKSIAEVMLPCHGPGYDDRTKKYL